MSHPSEKFSVRLSMTLSQKKSHEKHYLTNVKKYFNKRFDVPFFSVRDLPTTNFYQAKFTRSIFNHINGEKGRVYVLYYFNNNVGHNAIRGIYFVFK
ncbi:Hypothetical protein W5S_3769 [Pectobacterium parmentieri]|uniref:Uncharacterized protein n=1 Tax=Pectobacterium parmentieri TaxID=1905730 RepID=A0A0H3I9J5_PECPM|nr:Hypothetical protein W5S_3769 [Pectobacterium parmentieri]